MNDAADSSSLPHEAALPHRYTATDITDDALDDLYDQLDRLRHKAVHTEGTSDGSNQPDSAAGGHTALRDDRP